jgi:hypothetical protein
MKRRTLLAIPIGGMLVAFSNPVFGGDVLVRPSIKSPNFVHNVSGWSINRDGSAEFQNLLARATINLGAGPDIILDSATGSITIFSAAGNPIIVIDSAGLRLFQDIVGGGLVGAIQPDDLILIDPGVPDQFEVLPTGSGIDALIAGVSLRSSPKCVIRSNNVNTTINAAAEKAFNFAGATVEVDTDNMADVANDQIVFTTAGTYLVGAACRHEGTAAGGLRRVLDIGKTNFVSGNNIVRREIVLGAPDWSVISMLHQFAANDVIKLGIFSDQGGAVDCNWGHATYGTKFWATRLGD